MKSLISRRFGLIVLLAFSGVGPLKALTVTNYSATTNDRFSGGYPSSPVENTSPSFVAADYDLSGVGWATNNATKSFGFLSPVHYLAARHYENEQPTPGVNLFGDTGVVSITQASMEQTGYGVVFPSQPVGDIDLGTLTSPVPASANIARYAVLDLNSSSNTNNPENYAGQDVLVYGRGANGTSSPRVGSTTITSVTVLGLNSYFLTPRTDVQLEVGDSGSPVFVGWTNPNGEDELTVIGNNAAVTNDNLYNVMNFLGTKQVMDSLNNLMTNDGYALRVVGNPSATWGGSLSGNIGTGQNWSPSSTPSDTYVLFDAAVASTTSVTVNTNSNLRGLYFKSTASASDGFTFGGANTLTIGRGGITNYDNARQIFTANLSLGDHQYWDTGDGGITANNIATNGRLLEIAGGSATNYINGVISGTGSLALTSGRLALSGTSTYTGKTWIHQGVLEVNGSIATSSEVAVEQGASVTGHGRVSTITGAGSIDPGNSPGILTASSVNGAGGLDFNLEFTQLGSPDYGDAANSGNDVLRLTGSTPFVTALDGDNVIRLFFNLSESLEYGDVLRGGFFTDQPTDFIAQIENATILVYLAQLGGSTVYNSQSYELYDGPFSFDLAIVSETADFGSGDVNGAVLEITTVPEPSVYALLALGALFLFVRHARARRVSA